MGKVRDINYLSKLTHYYEQLIEQIIEKSDKEIINKEIVLYETAKENRYRV